MVVIRILVNLIQAILSIAADVLRHFSFLIAGILVTAVILVLVTDAFGTGLLALFRRKRNHPKP